MFLRTPSTYANRVEYYAAIDELRATLTPEELAYANMLYALERFGQGKTQAETPAIYIILVYNMRHYVRNGGLIEHVEFSHGTE